MPTTNFFLFLFLYSNIYTSCKFIYCVRLLPREHQRFSSPDQVCARHDSPCADFFSCLWPFNLHPTLFSNMSTPVIIPKLPVYLSSAPDYIPSMLDYIPSASVYLLFVPNKILFAPII